MMGLGVKWLDSDAIPERLLNVIHVVTSQLRP